MTLSTTCLLNEPCQPKNTSLLAVKLYFKCRIFHFTQDFFDIFNVGLHNIGSCGQSYKHFTIVIYDPRVVIWSVFKSGTTLEL